MIEPHEPDDLGCCEGGCSEADACGCGACACLSCNPEGAHFLGCDQGVVSGGDARS
jgi:hypothetical protein